MFEVATSCPECGEKGKTTTDNPAVVHKSIVCSDCKKHPNWLAAFHHLEGTRQCYQALEGTPGVNTSLALEHVFRPLAERYERGERSVELYEAMMSVE